MMKTTNDAFLRLPALGLLTLCSLAALAGCSSPEGADKPENAEKTGGAEKTEGAENVGEVAQPLRLKSGWDPLFSTPNARRIGDGYQFCAGDACGNPNGYQLAASDNSDCIGNPGQCSNQFSWQSQNNEWVARMVSFGNYRYFGLQNTIQSAPQDFSPEVWPALDRVKLIQIQVRGQMCGGPESYGRVPHYIQFLDPDGGGKGEISLDMLAQVGPNAPVSTMAMPTPGGDMVTEAQLMQRNGVADPPPEKWRVFEYPNNWNPPSNGRPTNMPCLGGAGNVTAAEWVEYNIDVPTLVANVRSRNVNISPTAQFTGSLVGGLELWSKPDGIETTFGEIEIKGFRVYVE